MYHLSWFISPLFLSVYACSKFGLFFFCRQCNVCTSETPKTTIVRILYDNTQQICFSFIERKMKK